MHGSNEHLGGQDYIVGGGLLCLWSTPNQIHKLLDPSCELTALHRMVVHNMRMYPTVHLLSPLPTLTVQYWKPDDVLDMYFSSATS